MDATAPIQIVIVADPPPTSDLAEVLVRSCSSVSGPGACVLGAGGEPREAARARVVVSFRDDGARARVEALRSDGGAPSRARDVDFRPGDPPSERYRAIGLVVAGLVVSRDGAPTEGAGVGEHPRDTEAGGRAAVRPVYLAAAGALGIAARPRVGVWIGTELPFAASLFGRVGVSFEETWRPDVQGLGEQREKLDLGVGWRWPLSDTVWLSIPLTAELEHLLVSVVEPGTGRFDSGGRVLVGAGGAVELSWALGTRAGVFLGARAILLDDSTTVRVQGMPATVVPAWESSLVLGLNVRIP